MARRARQPSRSRLPREFRNTTRREPVYSRRVRKTPTIITVHVPLPVSRSKIRRTVSYTYPSQHQRLTKTIRKHFKSLPGKYRMTPVRVKLPRVLPAVLPSYVSIRRTAARFSRLTVHSLRQTKNLLRREYNRRRKEEHKTRSRKARHGQLDSVRHDVMGILGRAMQSGSMRTIADSALVVRALGG